MKQFTLTFIDTAGIQEYIFNSNSLKHIVGASGLVHMATHDWVFEELVKIGKTNVMPDGKFNDSAISIDDLNSELVYAGGGNAVIIFNSNELAKEFTRGLTRKALSEAPGLQLIVVHKDFDWDKDALTEMIKVAIRKGNHKKLNRIHSTPLLGMGVTADCQYTGLPAVGFEPKEDRRISSEVKAKLDSFSKADERLKKTVSVQEDIKYIHNFDDFGTKYESSYIAVIHTDGNGMGKRVQEIAKQYAKPGDNPKYIEAIRAFSASINNVAEGALRATVKQLLESRDKNNKIKGVVEIRDNKLPFRPIIFGGDDVTFVSDGRLGITLAEFYLRQLTAPPLSDNKPISARAGIAVVKSHYPFSRVVKLADELADSAKKYIKKQQKDDISAMDWHFATSGVSGSLKEIRQREYTIQYGKQYGKLNMRPLGLNVPDWHSWETFTKIMREFHEKWVDKHSKVIMLSKTLRGGPEVVKQFVTAYEPHSLPEVQGNPDSKKTGWVNGECTCFDAIEAMDFYVPLNGGGK